MMFDDDMPPALHDYILSLPKARVFEIMWEALQLMQQYNGRTERYCIFRAAGFTEHEKDGRTVWKAPPPEPKDETGGKTDVKTPTKSVPKLPREPKPHPKMDSAEGVTFKVVAKLLQQAMDLKKGLVIDAYEKNREVLDYLGEQQTYQQKVSA